MTSQPDRPVTGSIDTDEDVAGAGEALRSGYVAGAGGVADADRAAGTDPEHDALRDPDSDVVVLDTRDGTAGAADNDLPAAAFDREDESALQDPEVSGSAASGSVNGTPVAAAPAGGGLDPQWHDIQAMFVDDPRASVEQAAAAADAAVSALADTLHQRQAALAPAGSTGGDHGDTEQLREALRSYRIFCQSVADLGRQLPRPEAMAR